MSQNLSLLNIAKDAISAKQPCGPNLRASDDFIRLKDEIRKLDQVHNDGQINWSTIAQQAKSFLTTQSKDILVAAYLFVAWLRLHKMAGVIPALDFFEQLLQTFNTQLQPANKAAAQRAALNWLNTHLEAFLRNNKADLEKSSDLKSIVKKIAALNEIFMQHFPGSDLNSSHRLVRDLLEALQVKKALALTATVAAPAKHLPEMAPEHQVEATEIAALPEVAHTASPENLEQQLLDKATLLRVQSPYSLEALIFARAACWYNIQDVVERFSADELFIPAPDGECHAALSELSAEADNEVSFLMLEALALENPYWFDAHYAVAQQSMVLTGKDYISNYLQGSLAQFFHSFPDLKNLQFSDDSPCANATTLDWISRYASTASTGNELETAIESLRTLKGEALAKDVATIVQLINHLPAVQEKVQAQLQLVNFLINTPLKSLAIYHLQQLETDFNHFHLEQWCPDLAKKILNVLFLANKTLKDQGSLQQIQFALAKLMVMDHNRFTELEKLLSVSQ
jgi:type VI secretion system protein VasJ